MHRLTIRALAGLLVAWGLTGGARADEVIVGTGEYPPFTTSTTEDQGCAITIVREAFASENWTVDLRWLPWSRNLKLLSQGDLQGSVLWFKSSERRKKFIYPKNPVSAETLRFIFRDDTRKEWTEYSDLSDLAMIVNKDYTYTEAFWDALRTQSFKVFEVESEDLNLKMLLKGRGDVTIMGDKVFEAYAEKLAPEQRARLVADTKPALVVTGYLIFSRSTPEISRKLIDVFDTGYEKIKDAPRLSDHFKECGLRP